MFVSLASFDSRNNLSELTDLGAVRLFADSHDRGGHKKGAANRPIRRAFRIKP
jgi:hypothetical protein